MAVSGSRPIILETKLAPSLAAEAPFPRARLAPPAAFEEALLRVALFCAPAGYGKTTQMDAWRRALGGERRRCAWLTLDSRDDDPSRLFRHLEVALRRTRPPAGRADRGEVEPVAALEALLSEGAICSGRTVLFLDDLHTVRAPASLALLTSLLRDAPEGLQCVLGSRHLPRLPLGALRVQGRLLDLGDRELRFYDDEAQALVAMRQVESAPFAQLRLDAEGWPAALALTARARRHEPDAAAALANAQRAIADYLDEVLLQQLTPAQRVFAERAAHFERFSLPMLQALGADRDAAGVLETLRADHHFLQRIDEQPGWWRFHPLAAAALRTGFRLAGGDARALQRTGAGWLHGQRRVEEAIAVAIRSEAWELAVQWVAESVESLVYLRGQHHTLLGWMPQLPGEWVDRFPLIRSHYAHALGFSPQQREVETQIFRLEQIHEAMAADPTMDRRRVLEIQCFIEMQKALSLALLDRGPEARACAEAWLAQWPEAPPHWQGCLSNVRLFGLESTGDIAEGLAWADRTRGLLRRIESWYSLAWTEYLAALLHLKRGALIAARRAAEDGLEILRQRLDGHPEQAAYFHGVLAAVAYETDDLDACARHLAICLPEIGTYGQADAVLMAFLTQARLTRARDGEAAGLAVLREGQDCGARRGFARVTRALATAECRWHARAGRDGEARRVALRCELARCAEALGEGRQAGSRLAAVEMAIRRADNAGHGRRSLEQRLIRTLLLQRSGHSTAALESLREALILGGPLAYFRSFLDEAADLLPLLDRLEGTALRGTEGATLVRRLRGALRSGSADPAPASNEALSPRERAILDYLASDLSSREIAQALQISPGTLKWHLHNIYGKLGVRSRTGAVAQARGLEVPSLG